MERTAREPQGMSVRGWRSLTPASADAWQARSPLIMRYDALNTGDNGTHIVRHGQTRQGKQRYRLVSRGFTWMEADE